MSVAGPADLQEDADCRRKSKRWRRTRGSLRCSPSRADQRTDAEKDELYRLVAGTNDKPFQEATANVAQRCETEQSAMQGSRHDRSRDAGEERSRRWRSFSTAANTTTATIQ